MGSINWHNTPHWVKTRLRHMHLDVGQEVTLRRHRKCLSLASCYLQSIMLTALISETIKRLHHHLQFHQFPAPTDKDSHTGKCQMNRRYGIDYDINSEFHALQFLCAWILT